MKNNPEKTTTEQSMTTEEAALHAIGFLNAAKHELVKLRKILAANGHPEINSSLDALLSCIDSYPLTVANAGQDISLIDNYRIGRPVIEGDAEELAGEENLIRVKCDISGEEMWGISDALIKEIKEEHLCTVINVQRITIFAALKHKGLSLEDVGVEVFFTIIADCADPEARKALEEREGVDEIAHRLAVANAMVDRLKVVGHIPEDFDVTPYASANDNSINLQRALLKALEQTLSDTSASDNLDDLEPCDEACDNACKCNNSTVVVTGIGPQ